MSSIILIDLSSIFWRYWHASESEDVSTAKRNTITLVESLIRDHTYSAVCVDAPPYNRTKVFPEYKAGRERKPLAVEELRGVVRELSSIGIAYYAAKGYEADDIIATLSSQAMSKGLDVYICGSDKDLLQISGVKIVDPFERKELTAQEKFGVDNSKVVDVLSLIGDTADNVPGLPGIGPKKALQILNYIGDVYSFLCLSESEKIELCKDMPEKMREVLLQNVIGLELSHSLVKLDFFAPVELKLEKETSKIDTEKTVENEGTEEKEQPAIESKQIVSVKSDAVVKADSRNANWSLALEPDNLNGAWKLATFLHESRMFGQFPNPNAVLAVILRGRSMGIDATTSLSSFHVIEGKPTMHASLIVGLIHRSKMAEYFECIETTDKLATWVTKRKGGRHEAKFTYTIEHADRAGLLRPTKSGKPSNWHSRPDTMLRWRAATELARMVYPDLTTGLYTPEEIEEGFLYAE